VAAESELPAPGPEQAPGQERQQPAVVVAAAEPARGPEPEPVVEV